MAMSSPGQVRLPGLFHVRNSTLPKCVERTLRSLLSAHSVEAGSDLGKPPIKHGGSAKPRLLPALDEAFSMSALPEIP
jgi:hypothetical protein